MFVDPRGINPVTGAVTNATQVSEDERLAAAMVRAGESQLGASPLPRTAGRRPRAPSDPFIGNAPGTSSATVLYSTGAPHAEGNSLGAYAPVPVAGGRAGITTLTVEVPEYPAAAAAALNRVEDLDRDLLATIFLEDPAVVTPSSGSTKP
jgi:hypothetical protein